MKTFNNTNRRQKRHLVAGIFLMGLGAVFMMKSMGILIPFWILSWPAMLLAAGVLIGLSRNLRPGGWMVMVLVGSIFTLRDVLPFDISGYTTALLLIGLGIYMIFKPKRELHFCDRGESSHPNRNPSNVLKISQVDSL